MKREKEKANRPRKLKRKMQAAMLKIVILQVCVIVGIFWAVKTEEELDGNAVQIFSDTIASQSSDIEERMVKWSDISDYQKNIMNIGSQMGAEHGTGLKELMKDDKARKEFLQQALSIVLKTLRENEVNSSFIILEGEDGSAEKDSIILRDMNPEYNSTGNKDILVITGPSELTLSDGFTLDRLWAPRLELQDNREFYDDTMQAGNNYPKIEAEELGHWSTSLRLCKYDQEQIVYTFPLLDENHRAYGVAGIGITLDYLEKVLGTRQIALDEKSGCLLGMTEGGKEYKTVSVLGNYYKVRLTSGSMLVTGREDQRGLTDMQFSTGTQKTVGIVKNIRLYNTNTPFEEQQWSLIGLIEQDVVYKSSAQFRFALFSACICSIVISILGAVFLTNNMLVSIKALMHNIDKMEPGKFKLLGTNIREFDELAGKIEDLSDKVYKMGSKVADIMEVSNLDMGICEVEKDTDLVFCTRKFMEIAELDMEGWKDNYLPKKRFRELMAVFEKNLQQEEDELFIYYFRSKTGRDRWLSIKNVDSEEGRLSIVFDVTPEILEKQKIKHERDYDVLTDLNNRRAFQRKVTFMLENHECRTGVISSWDLDNLKFVNDNFGHDMGDKYICLLAEVMLRNKQENMIMARMSGDEFMVFLYNEEEEEMYRRLEDIHSQFLQERLILPDGGTLSVSVSAGMASVDEAVSSSSVEKWVELSRYVDFAMYEVKKTRKGGIKRFQRESYVKDYVLIQGIGELNRILRERSVRYAFQPIVDVRTKKIFAYEALMRPLSNMIRTPDEFLRVAKSQSKLNQVEELTWFEALKQFKELKIEDREIKVFVNSIPDQCLTDKQAEMLISQYQELMGHVVLELTEGGPIHQEYEDRKVNFCSRFGIMCALDDYGSGYSNTDILISARFDFVKLDRSLVKDINFAREKQNLVQGMIEYCKKRNIKVIAEGVEKKEELYTCIWLGVDYVQGYYLAKPDFDVCTEVFEW